MIERGTKYGLVTHPTSPPLPHSIVEMVDGRPGRRVALLRNEADATLEEAEIMVMALRSAANDAEPSSPEPLPDVRLVAVAPVGEEDRYSQDDMDRSVAATRPFIELFMRLPVSGRLAILGSLLSTWCMSFDRPEAALAAFLREMASKLPGMFEEARMPRQ